MAVTDKKDIVSARFASEMLPKYGEGILNDLYINIRPLIFFC
ncbi:hypothetical protein AGMMS50233_11450 [Endomicrobiia bacterium]|nr:hypothetical protein AGMMS50233_11450 [Endomicrobiia bacterium]